MDNEINTFGMLHQTVKIPDILLNEYDTEFIEIIPVVVPGGFSTIANPFQFILGHIVK